MNECKGLLWSHKSYLQLSYVVHSHYFPFAVLIILSHSGPVYFMKAFQHPCIFKWGIRRVSKQKGNFERIICDYRQIVRNTNSSSEFQNIINLQKPMKPTCCHWSSLERGAGHQFSAGPTEYSEDTMCFCEPQSLAPHEVMFTSPLFHSPIWHIKNEHMENENNFLSYKVSYQKS